MDTYMNGRQIRVFISSTFRDMTAERDYLINRVFASLRLEAERHRVAIIPIDLRWGITEAEASTGRTASLCLDQIDKSRPFFIGLVGHRYGWCPTHHDVAQAADRRQRVALYVDQGMSMTEIEMQYGVLDHNPDDNIESLFMLKKDTFTDTVEPQIEALRQKIMHAEPDRTFWYSDLEQLGERVRKTLLDLLEKYYPLDDFDDTHHNIEALWAQAHHNEPFYIEPVHAMFAAPGDNSRGSLTIYTAEQGQGKSAAAAHRALQLNGSHEAAVIYLRCDTDLYEQNSRTMTAMLRRQLTELTATPNAFYEDTPLYKLTKQAVANQNSKGRRLYVVLDAPDCLEDLPVEELMSDILGQTVCNGVYAEVFVDAQSVLAKDADLYTFKDAQEKARIIKLATLNIDSRARYTEHYLDTYGKKLPQDMVLHLAGTKMPMQRLRFVLDQIVDFGTFETLPDHISQMLSMHTMDDLYMHVLHRATTVLPKEQMLRLFAVLSAITVGLPEQTLWHDILGWTPLLWAEAQGMLRTMLRTNNKGIVPVDSNLCAIMVRLVGDDNVLKARRDIARALKGTETHIIERAMQLYLTDDHEGLWQLLVDDAELFTLISEGYQSWTFEMVESFLLDNPVRFSISPLADALAQELKGVRPGTPMSKAITGIAVLILQYNHRADFCNAELSLNILQTFAGHFSSNQYMDVIGVLLDMILPQQRLKMLNRDEPWYCSLLAGIFIDAGKFDDAFQTVRRGFHSLKKGDNGEYVSLTVAVNLHIQLAYCLQDSNEIENAERVLDYTDDICFKADDAVLYARVQAARAVIRFVWAIRHDRDNQDAFMPAYESMANAVSNVESNLPLSHPLVLSIHRIYAQMLLVERGPQVAYTYWGASLNHLRPSLTNDTLLFEQDIPAWLIFYAGLNATQWASLITDFYTLRNQDDVWLPQALLWNETLASCFECDERETPRGNQLFERRNDALAKFEDTSDTATMPSASELISIVQLLQPMLTRKFNLAVFSQTFKHLGGTTDGDLAQAWHAFVNAIKKFDIEGMQLHYIPDLGQWFETLGGNRTLFYMCTQLVLAYRSLKCQNAGLMADCRLTDYDGLLDAVEVVDCPDDLAMVVVSIIECLVTIQNTCNELYQVFKLHQYLAGVDSAD